MTHIHPLNESSSQPTIGFLLVVAHSNYYCGAYPTFHEFAAQFLQRYGRRGGTHIWDYWEMAQLFQDPTDDDAASLELWWGLEPRHSGVFLHNSWETNPYSAQDFIESNFVAPGKLIRSRPDGNWEDIGEGPGYLIQSIRNQPAMLDWFIQDAEREEYREQVLKVILQHLREDKDPRVSTAIKFAELKRDGMI